MIRVDAVQFETITRLHFYHRLARRIASHSERQDWRFWIADKASVRAVWDAAWPQARNHPERVCALALTILAICAFERIPPAATDVLLADLGKREAAYLRFIAERRYLPAWAFD